MQGGWTLYNLELKQQHGEFLLSVIFLMRITLVFLKNLANFNSTSSFYAKVNNFNVSSTDPTKTHTIFGTETNSEIRVPKIYNRIFLKGAF